MTPYLQIIPRVLIVEDNPAQSRAMELSLSSASKEISDLFGVRPFKIDKAASVNGALKYLDKPYQPYDICLLDLSLPQNDKDGKEEPRAGYNILDHIVKTGAVKKVIIVSVFSEYKYVIEAFRSGAFDFVAKPYEPDGLKAQVFNCLRRLLEEECYSILDKRIREFIPYAEKGLARNLSRALSPLFTSVMHATDEIKSYAHKEYGLDPQRDQKNVLVRQLRILKESVSQAQDSLSKLQPLLCGDNQKKRVDIDDLLNRINQQLLPCLTVKKTELLLPLSQPEMSPVSTFQDDLQAIFTEIIVGGLSELRDYEDRQNIRIEIEYDEKRVTVRFEDDMRPISLKNADAINGGYRIISDPQFKRAWGLSVAQDIALSGGGYLTVEPKDRGNLITYNIPVTNYA